MPPTVSPFIYRLINIHLDRWGGETGYFADDLCQKRHEGSLIIKIRNRIEAGAEGAKSVFVLERA